MGTAPGTLTTSRRLVATLGEPPPGALVLHQCRGRGQIRGIRLRLRGLDYGITLDGANDLDGIGQT